MDFALRGFYQVGDVLRIEQMPRLPTGKTDRERLKQLVRSEFEIN